MQVLPCAAAHALLYTPVAMPLPFFLSIYNTVQSVR